jgi:hypothetical protein
VTRGTERPSRLALLTRATGSVRDRLLRRLEEKGERVRCRTRQPEDRGFAETRRSDAVSSASLRPDRCEGIRHGKLLVDSRSARVQAPAVQAFDPIRRIGGETGMYFADRLWQLRGLLDLLAGGVGVRRGRRDPDELTPGTTLDFWRVEAYEPNRLLRLRAEMRLPGRAWLQFEVNDDESGSTIRQTAIFHPTGLLGTAYWYGLFPVHSWIFAGMLRKIARATQAPSEARGAVPDISAGAGHG